MANKVQGSGKIKRDIRNTKRLLRIESLPPTVRQDNERKLEMLKNKLDETKLKNISQKYKMVRFFEKRKLYRRLKKLSSVHDNNHSEVQKIRDMINYIVYYPIGEKYISLLPKTPYTDESVILKQQNMMTSITEKVESGEVADASLNNWSKDKNLAPSNAKALQVPDLSVKRRRVHSKPLPVPSEDTSDDFFIIDRGT